jgi:hypothetical protein
MSVLDELAVETLARQLCAEEGWDPDERIACAPEEAVRPRPDGDGGYVCARWEPYAHAARKMGSMKAMAPADDDWDTF